MSESQSGYFISPAQQKVINRALSLIEKKFMAAEEGPAICSPSSFIEYLRLKLWDHSREHFMVLFLNNQNKLIAAETLFSGGLSHVEVHPRVIARQALLCNAAAVIIAHNHPGGKALPSEPDKHITDKIRQALDLLDIRTLDHFILTSGSDYYSFAEHGLLL
ncbi:DNA repair protein RadC [Salmonella enterica subsp. enterica]|nr:DNA repair protein RadC [Salmonella enterica subsp. enterica]